MMNRKATSKVLPALVVVAIILVALGGIATITSASGTICTSTISTTVKLTGGTSTLPSSGCSSELLVPGGSGTTLTRTITRTLTKTLTSTTTATGPTVTETSTLTQTAPTVTVVSTATSTDFVNRVVTESPEALLQVTVNVTMPKQGGMGTSITFPLTVSYGNTSFVNYEVAEPQFNSANPTMPYLGYYLSISTVSVSGCTIGSTIGVSATIGGQTISGTAVCPALGETVNVLIG